MMSGNACRNSALIINGGPCPDKRVIDFLPKFDEVLAVDSGFDSAISLGIAPDVHRRSGFDINQWSRNRR